MRFTFGPDSAEHSLSFKRETRETIRYTGEVIQSTFPFTTVTLFRQKAPKIEATDTAKAVPATWDVIREATVGAFYTDAYTHEKGRLAALRLLTSSMTNEKALKKAVWGAYMKRMRG